MDRLEKWKSDNWRVDFISTGFERPPELSSVLDGIAKRRGKRVHGDLVSQLFKMAKEVVFDVAKNGDMTLTPMTWLIDTTTFEYVLLGVIEGTYDDDDEVKQRIAWALINETPVVPNNDAAAPRLATLFADLFANGFGVDNEGQRKRYVLTEKLRFDPDSSIKPDRLIQPAEVAQLSARLREEQAQNAQAKMVLARLTVATEELRTLLMATRRNEHSLQRCLTKYPVFFGPSYRRVIPKHKLGDDYEIDYALELLDGSIDVMEIEASTHPLYNKNGNPTAALVHAEQQILDWLAWLDVNSPYARAKLPGIRRACGIVVIGRRETLKKKDEERLRWRNLMYAGRITILTYEDLLDRCETFRSLLKAEPPTSPKDDA